METRLIRPDGTTEVLESGFDTSGRDAFFYVRNGEPKKAVRIVIPDNEIGLHWAGQIFYMYIIKEKRERLLREMYATENYGKTLTVCDVCRSCDEPGSMQGAGVLPSSHPEYIDGRIMEVFPNQHAYVAAQAAAVMFPHRFPPDFAEMFSKTHTYVGRPDYERAHANTIEELAKCQP